MAILVIEIDAIGLQIADLNDKCLDSGDKQDALNGAANLLMAMASGNQSGTVQLTSRDSSASVSTSGSGSEQKTY